MPTLETPTPNGGAPPEIEPPPEIAAAREPAPEPEASATRSPDPPEPPDPPGSEGGATPQPEPRLHHVDKQAMGPYRRFVFGAWLVLAAMLIVTQIVAIWAAVMAATSPADPKPAMPTSPLLFGLADIHFTADDVLIVMVLLAGALGAVIAVSLRFLHWARRDELTRRDEWAYLMRPLQGAVLALVVYFTLRGGYLGQDPKAPVNPYGVAALSALIGLFTRNAVDKLGDIFETIFGSKQEDVTVTPSP